MSHTQGRREGRQGGDNLPRASNLKGPQFEN